MSGRISHKEWDFTVISNSVLRDDRLSLRARGLLAFLLSQPPDYRVQSAELSVGHEDREAIRSALDELETIGYLVRQRVRRQDGTFGQESVVYDEPMSPNMAPAS